MVASVGVRSILGQWVACTYSVWARSATGPFLPATTADYLELCRHFPEPEILEEEVVEGVTGVFPLYM